MSQSTGQKPNRLAGETSPYLLQHAFNPVNWRPWGEEAIETAKKEDKPIFLSIGYSACHWCHVMERESFENDEIAAVLNERFVSIKVDREERPDIDDIYMQATLLLTRGGGWPMSVFLTPELKPFFAGTYFPPEDGPRGMGFKSLCLRLAEAYMTEREKVVESSDDITRAILAMEEGIGRGEGELSLSILDGATQRLSRSFDSVYGGFGGAPKFPPSMALNLLLRERDRQGDPNLLDMVVKTLDRMAHGGIHDQILGGFARYSVDAQWTIPHFEKMLYDNAQLAPLYLDAFLVTGDAYYEKVGRRILDYVIRDMTDAQGGFTSAEDADSEGVEGKFYVWTPDEVNEILGEEDGRLFCDFYDITPEGNFEGDSNPNVVRPLAEFAAVRKMNPAELESRLDVACAKLEAFRNHNRIHPGKDDKVLTAWNGLMISAMARGAQVTGDARYREAAERASRFVLEAMQTGEGRLLRAWRAGKAHIPGFIDDYAHFITGLVDLFETTFDARWLEEAARLAEDMIELFYDPKGGFYTTDGRDATVVIRRKDVNDGALPSGNSAAVFVLLRLALILDEERYRAIAMKTLESMSTYLTEAPGSVHQLLNALSFALGRPKEIAIVGDRRDAATQRLIDTVHRTYLPGRAIAAAEPGATPGSAAGGFNAKIALLREKTLIDGKPTAYVCEAYRCLKPVHTPEELLAQLRAD